MKKNIMLVTLVFSLYSCSVSKNQRAIDYEDQIGGGCSAKEIYEYEMQLKKDTSDMQIIRELLNIK